MPSPIQAKDGSCSPAPAIARQSCLSVLVGAPTVVSEIPEGIGCFILDAEQESLQILQAQLKHRANDSWLIWRSVVLTADGQPIRWNRFNDRRLDGPWDEAWQRRSFPNARCRSTETLPSRRLDSLLDEFQAQTGSLEGESLSLVLRQGDPLAVLKGSGRWLRRFERVEYRLPNRGEMSEDWQDFNGWLTARCFVPDPDAPQCWRRDRNRTLESDLADALHQRVDLEQSLSDATVRLLLAKELEEQQIQREQHLTHQLAEQSTRLGSLEEELNRLRPEHDTLRCQFEAVSTRNSELVAQIGILEAERDQLLCDQSSRQNEHQVLAQQLQSLRVQHAELQSQEVGMQHHIASLTTTIHDQTEQIKTLAAEREQLLQISAEKMQQDAQQETPSLEHDASGDAQKLVKEIADLNNVVAMQNQQIDVIQTTCDLITKERDCLILESAGSLKGKKKRKLSQRGHQDPATSMLQIFQNATEKSADKWESYFPIYDRLLAPYRNKKARLLEIGVQNGGSLECWEMMLGPSSTVVGIDIDPKCGLIQYASEAIDCYVGDATSPEFVKKIVETHGPFDIIIDDGSHHSHDIISTFKILYPLQTDGGLYVVEDLHCCYSDHFGGCMPGKGSSAMSFFQALTDVLNYEHWSSHGKISINEAFRETGVMASDGLSISSLLRLQSIEFSNSLVVIKQLQTGINSLGMRIVSEGVPLVDQRVTSFRGTRLNLD